MKAVLTIVLFLLAAAAFCAEIAGVVIAVSDGDTVTLLDDQDKVPFRIRLDKIDAPEKKQPFGQQAKLFLVRQILNRHVRVRFRKIDHYGRIVGTVFADGREINLVMVTEGMAWHYAFFDRTPAYSGAEQSARAAKKGLWALPSPVPPREYRLLQKKR